MSEYAVLVPWVNSEEGRSLLLEVRSLSVKQPGEICFPGGRLESGETPADAAVRETCEELGIGPEAVEVISEPALEVMASGRTVYRVEALLHVGEIETLDISRDEVSEVFLIPEKWLRDNPPEFYDLGSTADEALPAELAKYLTGYDSFRLNGSTCYWEYEGHGIWGLTARIINRLISEGH